MQPSRRRFLKTSGLVLGAATLPPWILEREAAAAAAVDKVKLAEIALATAQQLGVTYADVFWYIRPVDRRTAASTGLTRDGVWYIENGKVQYPVRNFRFNQSLLEMLAPGNVDLIGSAERVSSAEAQGAYAALLPPLKVKEFHFTSQSEAV